MKINVLRSLFLISSNLLVLSGCSENHRSSTAENLENEEAPNVLSVIEIAEFYESDEEDISTIGTLPNKGSQVAWNTSLSKNQDNPESSSDLFTSELWGAFSFFSELAPRNYRGGATYGNYITEQQRFKISGEYLSQNPDFHFLLGDQKRWVSQFAIDGEYQYLIDHSVFQSFELGTSYVHAFNRNLGSERHIAGSNGSLSFIGTTLRLWNYGYFSAALNYDWVHFTRVFQEGKSSNGVGGALGFVQRFAKDFSLNLDAEFRQPFNSYRGNLNWNHGFSCCSLNIGLFGNLTHGHDGVRNIGTMGVQLGISFGTKPKACNKSNKMPSHQRGCYNKEFCDISQWVATPAVYVPIVLAIADEKSE